MVLTVLMECKWKRGTASVNTDRQGSKQEAYFARATRVWFAVNCHRWTKGNVDDYHLTPEQVNKCIKNKSFTQIKILHDISLLSNVNQRLCTYVGNHNVSPQSTLYKCLFT